MRRCRHVHSDVVMGDALEYHCQLEEGHIGFHTGERRQCNYTVEGYYCLRPPYHEGKCKTIMTQLEEDKLKKRNTKFQDGDKVRTGNPNTIYTIQGCDVRVNGVWYYLQGWTQPIHEVELTLVEPKNDPVNHPAHYTSDPSGIECITITRHRNFNIGNAIKYLWRAGLKNQDALVQDLRKSIWYIEDEIKRIEGK